MVGSIRFWCQAYKVIEREKNVLATTELGHRILAEDGLDPYLERPQTLWLLHWLLFAPPCKVPAWWIIMNEFSATNVRTRDLEEHVQSRVKNVAGWKAPSPGSVKKDINVFLQTYSTRHDRKSTDEHLDSPFRRLKMIRQDGDTIRFVYGKKTDMRPLIVAFACVDFVAKAGMTESSVPVSRLATEPGGIGNTFKLSESDLADMLEEACVEVGAMSIQIINGSRHLVLAKDTETLLDHILDLAYGRPKMVIR